MITYSRIMRTGGIQASTSGKIGLRRGRSVRFRIVGVGLFSEPANLARFFFVGLIVVGIVGLKLASIN